MSKVRSPLRFSRHFGIHPDKLRAAGVFDPVLQADTRLFIDPVLVRHSSAIELSRDGVRRIDQFFEQVYRLLVASRAKDDIAWKTAQGQLSFHEVRRLH
jgi:hypothetical protein